MSELKLSSPWVIYYRKIEAMFGSDPEITIIFDEVNYVLTLRVTNAIKGYAIRELLPKEMDFGNVKLQVVVDSEYTETMTDMFKAAFANNPVFDYAIHTDRPGLGPVDYVMFISEVAQYRNDDIGDFNMVCSTLYQEIAKDIFTNTGNKRVKFCTDVGTPF